MSEIKPKNLLPVIFDQKQRRICHAVNQQSPLNALSLKNQNYIAWNRAKERNWNKARHRIPENANRLKITKIIKPIRIRLGFQKTS
jgi:hypothetical protein